MSEVRQSKTNKPKQINEMLLVVINYRGRKSDGNHGDNGVLVSKMARVSFCNDEEIDSGSN